MLESFTKSRPRKSEKHRSDRKSKTSKSSQGSGNPPRDLSFLFVVNELIVDYDESGIVRDEWFNFKPPDYAHGYAAEIQSSVMRYHEGKVSRAPGWYWGRPDTEPGLPKAEGVIWRMQSHNVPQYAVQYKSFTTFSCGPLLPFVVAEGDPSTRADEPHLCPLLFFHPPSNDPMRGVSQVAFEESVLDGGPGPARYTAGRSPSWVSSLVPSAYSNQEANAPRSTGLGGELPIVLGLMAFSEARNPDSLENRTDEIFVGMPGHHGRWHDRRWTHNHRPSGYTTAEQEPRGFLAAVFLDPDNPERSTGESLGMFEWESVLVCE